MEIYKLNNYFVLLCIYLRMAIIVNRLCQKEKEKKNFCFLNVPPQWNVDINSIL